MQNLLRPTQITEAESERKSLEYKLSQPGVDKGAINGQLRRLNVQLEKQSPKMPTGEAKDAMVEETSDLLEKILVGMPSQEEMRKNPPGAVDKHMQWEKRNKKDIIRWKNNQLRLNEGDDNTEIANLEKFRPSRSTLNMDNAQIPGNDIHLPPGKVALHNVMSDEDKAFQADFTSKLIAKAIQDQDSDMAKFLGINLADFPEPEPKKSEPKKSSSKKSDPESIIK